MAKNEAAGPRRLEDVPEYRNAKQRLGTLMERWKELQQQLDEIDAKLADAIASSGQELDTEANALIDGLDIAEDRVSVSRMMEQREMVARDVQSHMLAIGKLHNALYGYHGGGQMRSASPEGCHVFPAVPGTPGTIRDAAARQVANTYAPEVLATARELAETLRQAAALNGRLRWLWEQIGNQRAEGTFLAHYCYPVFSILGEMTWPGGPTAAEAAEASQRGEAKAAAVERYVDNLRRAGVEID